MSKVISIADLKDEIEANIISKYLEENDIPHFIKKNEDLAYDGLLRIQLGWGHILAPEEYKDKILKFIDDARNSEIMENE